MAETDVGGDMTLKKKMTRLEFRKRADDILVRLTMEVEPFWQDSDDKQSRRLKRAAADPLYFCRTYLPHYFSHLPAPFHYELVKLLEARPAQVTGGTPVPPAENVGVTKEGAPTVVVPAVVAAPREFAKTTVCAFGYVLHQICFKRRNFIIIGSDTEDLASDLTGYLYLEMLYNERLHQDFGELVKANRAVDDFVTANDIRVKARGRGQRLRGLKHKQWRPDLVILDDLENDLNVRNPGIVQQILDWVKSAVLSLPGCRRLAADHRHHPQVAQRPALCCSPALRSPTATLSGGSTGPCRRTAPPCGRPGTRPSASKCKNSSWARWPSIERR